jgi:hypothetical protein
MKGGAFTAESAKVCRMIGVAANPGYLDLSVTFCGFNNDATANTAIATGALNFSHE